MEEIKVHDYDEINSVYDDDSISEGDRGSN